MNSTHTTSSVAVCERQDCRETLVAQNCPGLDEAELLEGLKRGDPAAQARVFNLYAPAVRRVLGNILREGPDVQDALQDTFVKVFKSAAQVRDPHALKGWVLRVASSVGLDEFRRRQRLRERGLLDHEPFEIGAAVTPVEARSALWDTYQVLSVMPEQEQEVFTLRYIDGLELSKIADVCEVSLATVKRRLGRAATRFNALARRQPSLLEWT